MLWHHLFLNSTGYGTLTHSLALFFKVCVALFLFVSGYGLTKQYGNLDHRNARTTIKLLLRRFTNFFLSYWFCFAIVVLIGNLCGYTFQDAYPATRNTLKCFILDVFGQMGYDSYLKPWWFNKMIIQLYLVFPLLYIVIYNRYSALIGLFAFFALQLYAKNIPGHLFFVIEGGLPAFYLGMVSARYQIVPKIRKKNWKRIVPLFSILIVVVLAFLHNHIAAKEAYQAILIRALIALFIVYTYKSFGIRGGSLMGFVGKYATIMYLTHVLFIRLMPGIIYYPKQSILAFVLFVVVSLGLAMMIDWMEKVSRFDKLRLAIVGKINNL